MKLLIITQKVDLNDDNLGFFHDWLEKFSEKLDKLYVICLAQGDHNLPSNVSVYSLGKEKGASKIIQLIRLQKNLAQILPKVDGVFVHMCSIYAITSFPLVKIFNKKMILWHTHKSIDWKLKLAEKYVNKILTASKESCRLKNRKKIEVLGHGINTEMFNPRPKASESQNFMIVSPGRISPTKDQETLINAMDILINKRNITDISLEFIGSAVEGNEKQYLKKLKSLVEERKLKDYIKFLGSIPYAEMPKHYQDSDLVINISHTGSIDKVVLEGMASGCLILTCNEAFKDILDNKYLFEKKNFQDLAEKIINLKSTKEDRKLREIVIKSHNLDNLIGKIIRCFGEKA